MSLRDAFLSAARARAGRRVAVEIPGGGTAYAVELSAGERDRFEAEHVKADRADFRARYVVWCLRDEAGQPVFGPEDVATLATAPIGMVEPLFDACLEAGRLSEADLKDLEKN